MPLRLNPQAASREIDRQGRTVTGVAGALEMERSYFSRCLTGTRIFPAEKIPRLAQILGVDPYSLLGPEDPRAAVLELARLFEISPSELQAASA